MSKKIICDQCKKEAEYEGSRQLEIRFEIEKTIWIWIKVKDEYNKEMDICRSCWNKIFEVVYQKPEPEKKGD